MPSIPIPSPYLSGLSALVFSLTSYHLTPRHATRMTSSSILFFATILLTVNADVVQWKPCPTEPNTPSFCEINEVRVNPCKEAAQGKACNLKKGEDAKISFDFTPKFTSSKLESRAYWANQLVDLPLMGMKTDACKDGTACPINKDAKNTYTINLPISKKYPVRPFDVKWKLWNVEKEEEACCFIFQIKLVK
ncbi:PREDICTED: MD-2-related lipid-recognition protein-like [Ceratosolen solmsi marchali]|uniref:MD-2-related lipid-recognition protein-like n=1 Tax=Ceratosolen solmsi marchali TaxID=326594 RepID=A0AAJ6YWA3_9HYME|nr:PREDICTED: MD-2-related lipid-recognition protein-like [Ceratosolen solmsi marchali]